MSLLHSPRCTDRSNGQSLPHDTRTSFHQAGCAEQSLADTLNIPHSIPHALEDSFTYYKAFLHTDTSNGDSANGLQQDDDGYTYYAGSSGAHDFVSPSGQQARAHATPYHLAVRVANRSNGVPLATIVEQGSYSTLNSRGSLSSASRFSSSRIAENHSPNHASHHIRQSVDDNAIRHIQQGVPHEHSTMQAMNAHTTLQNGGRSHAVLQMTMSVRSNSDLPRFPESQIDDADHDANERTPTGFFRGVLRNVRTASRTRSCSMSLTHTSILEARKYQPHTSDSSLCCQQQDCEDHGQENCPQNCKASNTMRNSFPTTPSAKCQTRNRKISLTNCQPSALALPDLPLRESSLPSPQHASSLDTVPHLLSPSVAARSREQPSSVRAVHPEPRDVADVYDTTEASTTFSNRHNHDTSAHYVFDGVLVPKTSASSLKTQERVKETSRNTSFCSTVSTSYSGTVLGVDLDLQYDVLRPARRSSSPMPV
jgi:hypothetical protein